LNRKSSSKTKWVYIAFIIILSVMLFSIPAFAATYTYDSLNRLTNVDYGGGKEISYAYDAGGNMLRVTAQGFDAIPPETQIALEGTAGKEVWYRSDVKVTLTATDNEGGSGVKVTRYSIDGATWTDYTVPFTISAEGITTVYYRSTDREDNVETVKNQTVKIDKTAPVITGAALTQPNTAGWYNTDVTVRFNAADALSGVDTVTPDTVISAEGASQSVSGTAADLAGNSVTYTVSGINIDKTPPAITGAALTQPNANGWYNKDVTVHYDASDKLSGIDTLTPDTAVSTEGAGQTATGTAVDKAGNSAGFSVTGINIDKTSPVTTATPHRQPNKNGWYNAGVQVSLSASDNLSGVAGIEYSLDGSSWTACTTAVTISDEGITDIYYRSADKADNAEKANKLTIRIDKTPPVITGSPTMPPNQYGWYNTDVTMRFTATDALSGVDTVTPDTVISAEGASQSVSGTAADLAGNSAACTVENINIDKTNPEININAPEDGAEYLLNAGVPADWSAADSLSGIAAANGDTPAGDSIDTATVGEKQFTVEASDKAGNRQTKTVTYHVRYNYIGLLEPIAGGNKIFKGNTVPVKFRLTDANGNTAPDATARLYLTSADGGGETEAVSTGNAAEGNLFRYDSGDEQYIFNLNTRDLQSGTWQLRVSLDDGTSKYANIEIEDKVSPPAEKPLDKKGPGSQGKEKGNGNSGSEPESPVTKPDEPIVPDDHVEPDNTVVPDNSDQSVIDAVYN